MYSISPAERPYTAGVEILNTRRRWSEGGEWDHRKSWVTRSRATYNNLVYPLRCAGNPICQSEIKAVPLLIRSPEGHLIILRTDIVVFFHLLSKWKRRPAMPHSSSLLQIFCVRHFVLYLGLYRREIPALWPETLWWRFDMCKSKRACACNSISS